MNTHYLVTYQWHPVVFVIAQGRSSSATEREREGEEEEGAEAERAKIESVGRAKLQFES